MEYASSVFWQSANSYQNRRRLMPFPAPMALIVSAHTLRSRCCRRAARCRFSVTCVTAHLKYYAAFARSPGVKRTRSRAMCVPSLLRRLFADRCVAVLAFAGSLALCRATQVEGVNQLIFSASAIVYGEGAPVPDTGGHWCKRLHLRRQSGSGPLDSHAGARQA